ncbi:MAG: TaqI-like C-terminal specificity domain-containing protein, partial [Myxococcota bacterium]
GEDLDALSDLAWRSRDRAERRRLGQVFTPRRVARQVLLELGPAAPAGGILDPACGGGVFLAEAVGLRAARARARGWDPAAIGRDLVAHVHGVDVDPGTARLARLVTGDRIVSALGPDAAAVVPSLPLPDVWCADATAAGALERLTDVAWIVGNPPYREAKGMAPEARDALRARFGDRLDGAFDLWACFVELALEHLDRVDDGEPAGDAGDERRIGFVLPNKGLVARYAAGLRRRLGADRRLHALIDLSERDVFGKVSVYPVIVAIGPPTPTFRSTFAVPPTAPLGEARLPGVPVDAGLPQRLMDPPVWFTVPDRALHGLIDRLAGRVPPLGHQAEVRSTCSFHVRGLRERYVGPGDAVPDGLPYLGGQSFARTSEVRPYGVDWAGYRIRFAADELRAIGNPLPPLGLFQRPKVVVRQHAKRAIAWFDAEGRFVTKDVYPIVVPRRGDGPMAAALTAVLNSRVFSVVYAVVYRGIAVGGGYLHFLPAMLGPVPVPELDPDTVEALADGVTAVQADPTAAGIEALDDRVSALYGLDDAEREAVRAFAARLGFP